MLLKFFKSNHPYVIFIIPLLGFVLWIPSLFNLQHFTNPIFIENPTLAFQWMNSYITLYPKASVVLALLFLILQSYYLIRLNFKYIFIETKTYLPSVLFILMASVLLPYQQLHPVLFTNFFLILSIDKSFVIDKEKNKIKRYFESGFFLSIGNLIYPHYYVFILLIFMALLILRNSTWREWMAPIIGFAIPIIGLFVGLFYWDKQMLLINNLKQIFLVTPNNPVYSKWVFIPVGLIAFVLLIALFWGLLYMGAKKISTRKYFTLFFWFFVLTIASVFGHPFIGYEMIYILAIPLAFLFSIFFTESRQSWLINFLFSITFISAIVIIWLH